MVRRSLEQRMDMVRAWQESGLHKAEYCRRHGIATSTFATWCQIARTMPDTASPKASVQIVQVGSVNFAVGRSADSGVRLEVGSVKIGLDVDFSEHALARALEVLKRC